MLSQLTATPHWRPDTVPSALMSLLQKYGGVYWPLQDISGTVARAINTALPEGRNIATNGTFSSDTGWSKGTGWSIAGGVAHCDGSQTTISNLYQAVPMRAGATYKITATISNYVAGAVQPYIGSSGASGQFWNSNGTKTYTGVAAGALNVYFQADADFVGDIDDVSITWIGMAANDPNFNGTYANAPTLAQPAGRLGRAVYLNGTNQDINVASPELVSMTNPTAGTLITFTNIAADVWADGASRYPVCFGYLSSDYITFIKHGGNYMLGMYAGSGAGGDVSYATGNRLGNAVNIVTWDTGANQTIHYINGVQNGAAVAGYGALGLLNTSYLRIGSYGGVYCHKGYVSHTLLLRGAISKSEVRRLANIAGIL